MFRRSLFEHYMHAISERETDVITTEDLTQGRILNYKDTEIGAHFSHLEQMGGEVREGDGVEKAPICTFPRGTRVSVTIRHVPNAKTIKRLF